MSNLIPDPEDFSAPSWSQGAHAGAPVANVATAPDGTVTADRVIDDNGGGVGSSIYMLDIIGGLTAGAQYTLSCFAKEDQLDWLYMFPASYGSVAASGYFDLGSGLVGTVGADVIDSGVISYPDDWYRCWLTFNMDPVDVSGTIRLYVAEGDGDNSCSRDSTSSILAWGVDFREGPLVDYESQGGTVIPIAAGSPLYLAVGRRMLDRPPSKRIYPKPKRGLFR